MTDGRNLLFAGRQRKAFIAMQVQGLLLGRCRRKRMITRFQMKQGGKARCLDWTEKERYNEHNPHFQIWGMKD